MLKKGIASQIGEAKEYMSKLFTRGPTTSQQTIPIARMLQNGVCRVNEDFYTKMIEFEDLNYDMLDQPSQQTLTSQYGELIRFFEPDVSAQIMLFNRKANEISMQERVSIPKRDDGLDDIRTEFEGIMKNAVAKGSNGIVKSKYIVFGIHAKTLKGARERLGSIEQGLLIAFDRLGARAHTMNGTERIRVLHEFFHQYDKQLSFFSYEDMKRTGRTEADYVAPSSFDFSDNYYFRMDRMHGSSYQFDIQASVIRDEIIRKLMEIDDNISISIHLSVKDQGKAMKLVKAKLSDVQKSKIDVQKAASRGGYGTDVLPPELAATEKALQDLYAYLSTTNEKVIDTSFIVTCFGETESKLNRLVQMVMGVAQPLSCEIRRLDHRQEQGLMATAPMCVNDTEVTQILTSSCVAAMVPFSTQELFTGGEALYCGINPLSLNAIFADRKLLRTPNGVILGTPGSGKSFAAKREILGVYLVTTDDIIICDPEREYGTLVEALGGQVIRLSANSKDYINPMDIRTDFSNEESPEAIRAAMREAIDDKASFILTLCDVIAGGEHGLENDEIGIVDKCVGNIYEEFYQDPDPECMPTLETLHQELIIHPNKKAERIANCLEMYVSGSQNYFNHRSNIDISNRVVCFDIKDLSNQLSELGMLIVQNTVWNRVGDNREKGKTTRYYCDEFHVLLRSDQTARYMVDIWKRFRKWGGIPTALTQNVTDFLRSKEIEGIIGNSDFVLLLNQSDPDQKILGPMLNLSEKQLQQVTNAEPGSGLIKYDNIIVPFSDKYPKDTKSFAMMTTRPQDLAVLRQYKGKEDTDG